MRTTTLDRVVDLDGVPDGYRAMNDRESIKMMVTLWAQINERISDPLRFYGCYSAHETMTP